MMSNETAACATHKGERSPAAHYGRLALALAALVVLFLVARSLVVPDTFGQEGHFRAAALGEIAAQETYFTGSFGCGDCHAERVASYATSPHKNVTCETCHGPARGHLTSVDADRVALQVNREIRACLTCHEAIVGRPDSQPQINLAEHATENEFEPTEGVCLDCHSVEE